MRRPDAEQLARRSVPPSTLSLLGLVRHLARVEHSWFRRVLEGQTGPAAPLLERRGPGPRLQRRGRRPTESSPRRWESWRREVAHAREVLRQDADLGATVDVHGEPTEVRDIIVHMIEEYARHWATPTCCASASTAAPASDPVGRRARRLHDVGPD